MDTDKQSQTSERKTALRVVAGHGEVLTSGHTQNLALRPAPAELPQAMCFCSVVTLC